MDNQETVDQAIQLLKQAEQICQEWECKIVSLTGGECPLFEVHVTH